MPIKIDFLKKKISKLELNTVLFCNGELNTGNIKKYLSKNETTYINDLLKTSDPKKKIYIFEISSKKKNHINFN